MKDQDAGSQGFTLQEAHHIISLCHQVFVMGLLGGSGKWSATYQL
jgi:hypothetical protein